MARSFFHALPACVVAVLVVGCASSGPVADEPEAEEVPARYGERSSSRGGGAVARVDPDEIESSTARRLEDLLVGRVAGVQIETLSNGEVRLIIRGRTSIEGSNEPLYVVDGVTLLNSAGGLTGINPADIESIEVLKDGSATLYGSRGANGVILITTKRGR